MCGIFGIIKNNNYRNSIQEYILNGLEQLQNRGYDSAGICYIGNNKYFNIYKYCSTNDKTALNILRNINYEYNENINIGFGHNRWATHGIKNDINAHPHLSFNKKFVLVHNGIIENYLELKEFCCRNKITFNTQTDTEVIVNIIEYYYEYNNNTIQSIEKCMSILKGTYGCILQCIDEPNVLYTFRKGSPICIGKNDGLVIITSEQSGFCNLINNYITLKNNDICRIEYVDNDVKYTTKESYIYTDIKDVIYNENIVLSNKFKHWTIKEIYEQPITVSNSINNGGRIKNEYEVQLGGLQQHYEKLSKVNNIIILGCGSSYYAGLFGKVFFKKLCNFNSIQVIEGSEFELDDIVKTGLTAIIMISQSGETKDLYQCIECIQKDNKNIITIGIINVIDSLIAREVDCGVYCNAGKEVGVASTKSFTSQVICLSLIAIWFSQIRYSNLFLKRAKFIKDLHNLSYDIQKTIDCVYDISNKDKLEYICNVLNKHSCFILGKGTDEIVAKEGALKIKEITYIHSEGYSSSSLKHGPFALLDENIPVILINLEKKYNDNINSCYEEIKCRQSPIILISNNYNENDTITIPYNSSYGSLLGVIVLQIIAYEISIKKGINPDIPKNLAKVVTVL